MVHELGRAVGVDYLAVAKPLLEFRGVSQITGGILGGLILSRCGLFKRYFDGSFNLTFIAAGVYNVIRRNFDDRL